MFDQKVYYIQTVYKEVILRQLKCSTQKFTTKIFFIQNFSEEMIL